MGVGINAFIAALDVGVAWWVAGRIGVGRLRDRFALILLLGSTAIWWVTTRGVWHTGHLVATMLLLLLLAELWGRKRPAIFGLLIGAAFLTRPPLAFVGPVFALWYLWPPSGSAASRWRSECACSRGGTGAGSRSVRARVRVLPALQRHPVRLADGVRLRARSAPRWLARCATRAVRAGPRRDERRLPVQAAGSDRDVPVLPAGRAGDVGVLHQPGVARRGAGALAGATTGRGCCWAPPSRRRSRRCSTTAAAGSSTATATSSTRSCSSGRCVRWRSPAPGRISGGRRSCSAS